MDKLLTAPIILIWVHFLFKLSIAKKNYFGSGKENNLLDFWGKILGSIAYPPQNIVDKKKNEKKMKTKNVTKLLVVNVPCLASMSDMSLVSSLLGRVSRFRSPSVIWNFRKVYRGEWKNLFLFLLLFLILLSLKRRSGRWAVKSRAWTGVDQSHCDRVVGVMK